ncbi:type II toxin-antitoxin system RelE/ParE family toxin [bacterium]|jgi:toxin ParE1/3/4|nr:type II toxin-antitoxin system RelE/ParE family toxin [Verrucomicrobiota bacterium]MDA7633395.1 type II toxin-antitoxin system RelE/ParE family toxin [bacterium]
MAKLIWTEPALADLDAIADYIALDDERAAKRLVAKVFDHVEQLNDHPKIGSVPAELRPIKTYRQIVEPPCRVFYRISGKKIYIVHVMRGEQLLKKAKLTRKRST